MRALIVCLVIGIAAAHGDACPTVYEGSWPFVPYYNLRGAKFDPETKGPVAIPPRPRLFVMRKFSDTSLPVFRTPQGDAIPLTVTECGRFVVVDLEIDSGMVVVEDSARSGDARSRTQTFIIRSGLPAATRHVELITDSVPSHLIIDSDAVAIRIDYSDGTQEVRFLGPYNPIPQGGRGARVVALYANRTEEVIFGDIPPLENGRSLLVLGLSLLGIVVLVGFTVRSVQARRPD